MADNASQYKNLEDGAAYLHKVARVQWPGTDGQCLTALSGRSWRERHFIVRITIPLKELFNPKFVPFIEVTRWILCSQARTMRIWNSCSVRWTHFNSVRRSSGLTREAKFEGRGKLEVGCKGPSTLAFILQAGQTFVAEAAVVEHIFRL